LFLKDYDKCLKYNAQKNQFGDYSIKIPFVFPRVMRLHESVESIGCENK